MILDHLNLFRLMQEKEAMRSNITSLETKLNMQAVSAVQISANMQSTIDYLQSEVEAIDGLQQEVTILNMLTRSLE
jgi:phage terminase large subunit-like protein